MKPIEFEKSRRKVQKPPDTSSQESPLPPGVLKYRIGTDQVLADIATSAAPERKEEADELFWKLLDSFELIP